MFLSIDLFVMCFKSGIDFAFSVGLFNGFVDWCAVSFHILKFVDSMVSKSLTTRPASLLLILEDAQINCCHYARPTRYVVR